MWSVSIVSNTRLYVRYNSPNSRQISMLFAMRIPNFIQPDAKESTLLMDAQPIDFSFDRSDEYPMTEIKEGERHGNLAVSNNRLLSIPVTMFTDFISVEHVQKPVLLHTKNSCSSLDDLVSLCIKHQVELA